MCSSVDACATAYATNQSATQGNRMLAKVCVNCLTPFRVQGAVGMQATKWSLRTSGTTMRTSSGQRLQQTNPGGTQTATSWRYLQRCQRDLAHWFHCREECSGVLKCEQMHSHTSTNMSTNPASTLTVNLHSWEDAAKVAYVHASNCN